MSEDDVPDDMKEFIALNAELAKKWPVISEASEHNPDAEQWRDVNFPGIAQQLDQLRATVVLVQFGQMESLAGAEKLPEFVSAFEKLLAQIERGSRRIVLVSPMPFENPKRAPLPDLTRHNADAKRYAEAVREIAARRGLHFVDVFTPLAARAKDAPTLTDDGLHLNERGHEIVADEIAQIGRAHV